MDVIIDNDSVMAMFTLLVIHLDMGRSPSLQWFDLCNPQVESRWHNPQVGWFRWIPLDPHLKKITRGASAIDSEHLQYIYIYSII